MLLVGFVVLYLDTFPLIIAANYTDTIYLFSIFKEP